MTTHPLLDELEALQAMQIKIADIAGRIDAPEYQEARELAEKQAMETAKLIEQLEGGNEPTL